MIVNGLVAGRGAGSGVGCEVVSLGFGPGIRTVCAELEAMDKSPFAYNFLEPTLKETAQNYFIGRGTRNRVFRKQSHIG
ncbi:MAG TPA: hypothetical protein VLO07_06200 [Thermoanaerobaculia bacterium]|nr:hypothetical protein [Thermoanaerobaculia bacterium]